MTSSQKNKQGSWTSAFLYLFFPWHYIHKYEKIMRGIIKAGEYAAFLAFFNNQKCDNICIALLSKEDLEDFKKREANVVPIEMSAHRAVRKPTLVKKED